MYVRPDADTDEFQFQLYQRGTDLVSAKADSGDAAHWLELGAL
jgi:hypothetical protein